MELPERSGYSEMTHKCPQFLTENPLLKCYYSIKLKLLEKKILEDSLNGRHSIAIIDLKVNYFEVLNR